MLDWFTFPFFVGDSAAAGNKRSDRFTSTLASAMGMFEAGPEASVACPVSLRVGEVIVWLAFVAPLVDAPLRAELEAVSVVLG